MPHLWECAAWNAVRSGHPAVMSENRQAWPPCFSLCGVRVDSVDMGADRRKTLAMSIQMLMVDIVQARNRAVPSQRVTTGRSISEEYPVEFLWGWDPL